MVRVLMKNIVLALVIFILASCGNSISESDSYSQQNSLSYVYFPEPPLAKPNPFLLNSNANSTHPFGLS
jgi:hypothetical protein